MPPPASPPFLRSADGLPIIRCGLLGRDGLTHCFQALGTESTAANLHSRPRGQALLRLLKRRLREYRALRRTLTAPRRGGQASGALVWLLDNDASLSETARDLARDLPPGFHRELPQQRWSNGRAIRP